jgi:hypothetical protein
MPWLRISSSSWVIPSFETGFPGHHQRVCGQQSAGGFLKLDSIVEGFWAKVSDPKQREISRKTEIGFMFKVFSKLSNYDPNN